MTPQEAIAAMIDDGMSQAEIARQCNVKAATISQLASGKNKNPIYTLGTELVRLGKLAKRRKGKKNEKK
jgi:transcriptional regulator with XRE-family HTH domain